MRWPKLLIVALIVALASPAFAVPHSDAEEAYASGDYKTAFALWLPLAERGSARAQMNIARMYERGDWVAKDSAMAAEWYRRAAEQAVASQQTVVAQPAPVYTQPVYAQPVYTQPVSRPVYYPVVRPVPRPIFVPLHRHGRH